VIKSPIALFAVTRLAPPALDISNFCTTFEFQASKVVGIISTLENPHDVSGFLCVSNTCPDLVMDTLDPIAGRTLIINLQTSWDDMFFVEVLGSSTIHTLLFRFYHLPAPSVSDILNFYIFFEV
jgi:hypothetical protein